MINVTGMLKLDDIQVQVHDTKDLKVSWEEDTSQTRLVIALGNMMIFISAEDVQHLIVALDDLLVAGEDAKGKPGLL